MMGKLRLGLPFFAALLCFFFSQNAMACGFDYVSSGATTMEFNVGGQQFFGYVGTNTWMTNLQGYNFGTVSALSLTKVTNITWESCNNHVLNATFYYRIYANGATPGAFITMPLPNLTNTGTGDYRTKNYIETPNLDLLNGLSNGTVYYFEMYYRSDVDTNGDTTPETNLTRNNAGVYYKCQFQKAGVAGGGLTVSFSNKINATCSNSTDGKVTASATGGTAPFTYFWSNGSTLATPLNLAAGTYSVTVTSSNALTGTSSTAITAPAPVVCGITATDETSSTANNGTATPNPSGGTAPYSYLWNNGSTIANRTGLDSGNYTLTVTDSKGCTGVQTVTISVGGTIPTGYCASSGVTPWQDWIDKVQIGGLNNTSSKGSYTNFTNLAAPDLTAGEQYPITVSATGGWFPYEEHWAVWIDYNRNGVFESNEQAVSYMIPANPQGLGTITCNQIISIPTTAQEGITRMRVAMKRGTVDPTACEAIPFGEVEDYHVRINPPTGTCTMTAAVSNILCDNNGTDMNPADDRFSFSMTMTETPLAAGTGWTTLINSTTFTGTYGTAKTMSYFPISGGNLNFTVTHNADPTGCKKTVFVTAPATCSNNVPCSISAAVSSVVCDNNGTTNTGADDVFSFTLNVLGTGTGSGWTALINGVNQTGLYNVAKTLGPYPISGGVLNFTVKDAAAVTCTAPITVAPPSPCSVSGGPTGYCAAGSSFPWHEWISKVGLSNLLQTSTKQPYNDFTTSVASVVRSQSYPLSLAASFSWDTNPEYFRVFADWNRDGIFQEATETAYSGILQNVPFGTQDAPLNGNISIPATAGLGPTRMRVTMKRGAYATACETTIPYGEVEDYTLDIAASLAGGAENRSLVSLDANLFDQSILLKTSFLAGQQIDNVRLDKSSDGNWFEPLKEWNNVYLPENHLIEVAETDAQPFDGDNFYRLVIGLHDGSVVFSEIKKVENRALPTFTVYPNPTDGMAFLDLHLFDENATIKVQVVHPTGRLMFEKTTTTVEGQPLELDLKSLPNGEYFVFIQAEKHRPICKKLWLIRE